MTSGNTSVSDAVMADAAVALAALVSRGGVGRLGVCAADGCGRAFYDRSRATAATRPADVRQPGERRGLPPTPLATLISPSSLSTSPCLGRMLPVTPARDRRALSPA